MGYSTGHCKIRPVHVDGLAKRYRRLLGKLRYLEKNGEVGVVTVNDLSDAIAALAKAIHIIEPTLDLAALRQIPYSPPQPLPGRQLTRATLSALRTSAHGASIDEIVATVSARHNLVLASAIELARFTARVTRMIGNLMARQIIQQVGHRYVIKQTA